MSNKPDRPVLTATLGQPSLVVRRFPLEKEALEEDWAQQFCDAYEKQHGIKYVVAGRAAEPGDVLLHRDGEPDVQLQITEAVDPRRVGAGRLRERYSRATWDISGTLKDAFKGIKIAIIDGGQMYKLPQDHRSADGQAVANELGKFLLALEPVATALPVCPPGSWPRQSHIFKAPNGVEICVFLTRYAESNAKAPAQWLWCGPAWEVGGEHTPHCFLGVIENKIQKAYARSREPLWLLVYSVDCPYDAEQEADIQAYLAGVRNPFDRIFVLHGGQARQVSPAVDDPATTPSKKGYTILGSDKIPAVDDPRYADIE